MELKFAFKSYDSIMRNLNWHVCLELVLMPIINEEYKY